MSEESTPMANGEPVAATSITIRHPGVPVSMEDLAALRGEAEEIVKARAVVMTTLRMHAIRLTSPEDWLLFKDRAGAIIGYLQDCGCDRVRDLFGIEVFGISTPEKIQGATAGEFHYVITGSGRCRVTGQVVETIEGGRSSTDDFCEGKVGIALDLAVRKATRANLDGNITRELAGMKSVPLAELHEAWVGTKKKTDACRLGRGFGTRAEREGAQMEAAATEVVPPLCDLCQKDMRFVPAGTTKAGKPYPAFWSCPEYQRGADGKGNGHSTVNDAKYRELLAEETPA